MYIYEPIRHTLGEPLEYFESPYLGSLRLSGAPPTLEAMACRLLCAANLAYGPRPQATSPYYTDPVQNHYYTNAGFIDRPDVFDGAGTKGIDSCLIGSLKGSPNDVVLAFRGTLPPILGPSLPTPENFSYQGRSLLDWANDFEAVLVDFTKIRGVKVHKGFNDTVNSFFGRGIVKAIQARLKRGARLYITGHSKGGALAHVAALLLGKQHPQIPLGVISFEAPRAGGTSFAAAYNALKTDTLRYEFMDDILPHLPLSGDIAKFFASMPLIQGIRSIFYPNSERTITFEHVGELRFIDWSGNVVIDKPGLQEERYQHLKKKLVPFGTLAILALLNSQHPVSCYTEAWKAICKMEPCKF